MLGPLEKQRFTILISFLCVSRCLKAFCRVLIYLHTAYVVFFCSISFCMSVRTPDTCLGLVVVWAWARSADPSPCHHFSYSSQPFSNQTGGTFTGPHGNNVTARTRHASASPTQSIYEPIINNESAQCTQYFLDKYYNNILIICELYISGEFTIAVRWWI